MCLVHGVGDGGAFFCNCGAHKNSYTYKLYVRVQWSVDIRTCRCSQIGVLNFSAQSFHDILTEGKKMQFKSWREIATIHQLGFYLVTF